jgi:6-pyruvoyltetrahydropterin/6-carboxytetrahydropterin synthase
MYEVGVVAHFEAAHRLIGDFGPAQRMHGHTYRVEVSVRGPQLAPDGTLVDIGVVQTALRTIVDSFHYQNLDDLAVFHGKNSTAEVVAAVICDTVMAALQQRGLASIRVAVWESGQAWAAVQREFAS